MCSEGARILRMDVKRSTWFVLTIRMSAGCHLVGGNPTAAYGPMRHYRTELRIAATHSAVMDPAMFIEAEQARLANRTQKAKEQVSDGVRRLAEQRSLVEELERHSRSSGPAKLALISL